MTASRHRLTLTLQNSICSYIRSGSFPHVAAEAAGVPREVFEDWLKRGQSARSAKKYRLFREAILQAQAIARLAAESRALTNDPLTWLRSGPGKDSPDSPGWSSPPRGTSQGKLGAVLMQRETQELIVALLRVLQPFPEVRTVVAEALDRLEQDQASRERKRPEEASAD